MSGDILHLPDLEHLMVTSQKLYESLKGEAELPCIEPELSVKLKASSLGQIEMTVDITPDQLHQKHNFVFEIDQSYSGYQNNVPIDTGRASNIFS